MLKTSLKGIVILSIFIAPAIAGAHSGRTDSAGCHTCKTNCPNWGLDFGEYHCHASKGVPQPEEPVRSIRNDTGTGTTIPAPEYKTPPIQVEPVKTPVQTKPEIKANNPAPTKTEIKAQPQETQKPITPSVKEIRAENPEKTETALPSNLPAKQEKKRNIISKFFGWLF